MPEAGEVPSAPPPRRDWLSRLRSSRWGNVVVLAVTTALVLLGVWLVNRDDGVTEVTVAAASDVPPPKAAPAGG